MPPPTRSKAVRRARAPFVRVLGVLGLVTALHVVGLFLFTSGFLLQRVELNEVSTCDRAPVEHWDLPTPPPRAAEGDADALAAWDAALASAQECTLPPRFGRVVLWIVDALRYDFVAEAHASDPFVPNAFMHNHILTPEAHTNATPRASFLAHFVAHPPTTTLQRLKGLTTGSLPTFIEAGANFGGAGRILEDTWIAHVRKRVGGKRVTFVGDDTWQMVLADLFDDAHPYSSFNVEDLDTVDAGVEVHMLDTMDKDDWALLVAHSLGVDHVGHRFGPAHARMPPKLAQMDRLVRDVVQRLGDDTLFVLLGDHGMDTTGDHGGDSELEVGSALWMYAKQPFVPGDTARQRLTDDADVAALLATPTPTPAFQPFSMLPVAPFVHGHRSLPQIDLVPTLALLLGVPIPFNNLGAVIPEVFGPRLLRALRMNARQIKTYLDAYAQRSADLRPFAAELHKAWRAALQADARLAASESDDDAARAAAASAYLLFVRLALDRAHSVWAQFDYARMALGMLILTLSVVLSWLVWRRTPHMRAAAPDRLLWDAALPGAVYGGGVSAALAILTPISVLESVLGGVALGTAASLVWHLRPGSVAIDAFAHAPLPAKTLVANGVAYALVALHALMYASNSFTMWEDRITLGLVGAVLVARAWMGLGAPLTRWQQRIPIFAVLALLLLRLASMSRVCREEQAPFCTPSFYTYAPTTDFADNPAYALSGPATNSPYALGAAYLAAFAMADVLRWLLKPSRAHLSTASTLLTWVVRPAMLGAAGFWLADWAHGLDTWDDEMRTTFLTIKIWTARVVLLILALGGCFWYMSPLSLSILREPAPERGAQPRVMLLGFGNTFGAAFLLITSIVFALVFLLSQPMGQLALSACFLAMLFLIELGDSERDAHACAMAKVDAKHSTARTPSLLEVVCIGLVGFVAFFGTGHQATFTAIQWRVAFVGFPVVTYPWSPAFVVLNAFGPLSVLPAFGVVLLTLWNVAPTRAKAEHEQDDAEEPQPMRLASDLLRSALGLLMYVGALTLSAASWAWFFRRHLMLFKIWVPRFMTAGLHLMITDVALLAATAAAWWIASRTARAFGTLYT